KRWIPLFVSMGIGEICLTEKKKQHLSGESLKKQAWMCPEIWGNGTPCIKLLNGKPPFRYVLPLALMEMRQMIFSGVSVLTGVWITMIPRRQCTILPCASAFPMYRRKGL